jgi:23S rRNA-/tRNA-specific pseudouridylate synthase
MKILLVQKYSIIEPLGLMVIAKDEITQSNLVKQLQSKKVFRDPLIDIYDEEEDIERDDLIIEEENND